MPGRVHLAAKEQWCWSGSRNLLVLLLFLCSSAASALTPLTEIAPTNVELGAFAATVVGALTRLRSKTNGLEKQVRTVHVVGASSVEAAVDWTPVCESGVSVVLVGPQVESSGQDEGGCVTTVKGLYSAAAVRSAQQPEPDAVFLLNSDLYMPYWARTLADLLRQGIPVVVTMYCQYEGAKLERLLKWADVELTPERLAEADATVQSHPVHAQFAVGHASAGDGGVPEPDILWSFDANPHAHDKPKNCYNADQHGTRNGYWLSFRGQRRMIPPEPPREGVAEQKAEL